VEIWQSFFEEASGVLVHLAWVATPGVFWNSLENIDWRIQSKKLIDSFFLEGGQKVINIGSSAEYLLGKLGPILETDELNSNSLYGKNKSELSQYLEATYQSKFTNLRVFNLYGLLENKGRLVPDCIDSLASGHGFVLHQPRQVRDFIFINDLVRALIYLLSINPVGHLNLGTGIGTSTETVASMIGSKMGRLDDIDTTMSDHTSSIIVASTSKFTEIFPNFRFTTLDEGLTQSIIERRKS
jgi:nucleoside-diphosphate-sugar epimerase